MRRAPRTRRPVARGDDLLEGLRLGAAAGSATAGSSGTSLGSARAIAELEPKVEVRAI